MSFSIAKTPSLKGKTALVTGGNIGLGFETVKALASKGAHVLLAARNEEKGKAAVAEVQKLIPKAQIELLRLDLASQRSIKAAAAEVGNKFSQLDLLINNAGITGPTAPLWEYDVEMWNKIVQINLVGTFNCCRAIVPNMIENNYGRIVNVASVAGKDGNANASAYSSGKAGAIGLTKSLGKELADKNIAVNAVTPAGAKTRILDQMSKEHVQRMLSKVPRGRFLEIHEFTSLVCWLSSEENSFSTAAVFDISGGRSTY